MEDIVLRTNNLTKSYGSFTALDHVNLTVRKGDIYALIGRNGAGKTTLMKIINSLTPKYNGSFELFGQSDTSKSDSHKRLGCLIENPAFFQNLTAYQNLKYYALQKGICNIDAQIEKSLSLVNLTENRNKKFKNFSLGMKQRLGIAFALLDNPDFIILDEPINGIDPIGIRELRETFFKLNEEENITILISSHILSELYHVADHFCILERGKVARDLTKEELDHACSKCIAIQTGDGPKATFVLENVLHTCNYKVISDNEIHLFDFLDQPELVNKTLVTHDIPVMSICERGSSLEEYFKSVIEEVERND